MMKELPKLHTGDKVFIQEKWGMDQSRSCGLQKKSTGTLCNNSEWVLAKKKPDSYIPALSLNT